MAKKVGINEQDMSNKAGLGTGGNLREAGSWLVEERL